jgi:hypothetical protein
MQQYPSTFIRNWLKVGVASFSGIMIGISAFIRTVDIGILQRAQGAIEYRLDILHLNLQNGTQFERI